MEHWSESLCCCYITPLLQYSAGTHNVPFLSIFNTHFLAYARVGIPVALQIAASDRIALAAFFTNTRIGIPVAFI